MPVQTTDINWTDLSANAWVACAKVSAGCAFCWAAEVADRFDRTPEKWTEENIDANLRIYESDIAEELSRHPANGPAWCFFPSSSDPYLPWLPAEVQHEYLDAIREHDHICYQVCTKWGPELDRREQEATPDEYEPRECAPVWPRHVMLGVTVEKEMYEYRLEWLRKQTAATKFVSFEPLLEEIEDPDLSGIDWAIVGGESGINRREWKPRWAGQLLKRCREQDVAFFFKQHGDRFPQERTKLDPGLNRAPPRDFREFPEVPEGVVERPVKYG